MWYVLVHAPSLPAPHRAPPFASSGTKTVPISNVVGVSPVLPSSSPTALCRSVSMYHQHLLISTLILIRAVSSTIRDPTIIDEYDFSAFTKTVDLCLKMSSFSPAEEARNIWGKGLANVKQSSYLLWKRYTLSSKRRCATCFLP